MNVTRRWPRRRALYLVALVLLVSLIVVSTFGTSAAGSYKPRNNPDIKENKPGKAWPAGGYGEINGSTAANDCWSHHRGEGMRDAFIVFPILPLTAPVGQDIEIPVQIINPWKQVVRKIELDVTLLGAPIVAVHGGSKGPVATQDINKQFEGELGRAKTFPPGAGQQRSPTEPSYRKDIPIQIPYGTAALIAELKYFPSNTGPAGQQDLTRDAFERSGYRPPNPKDTSETEPGIGNQFMDFDGKFNTSAKKIWVGPKTGLANFTLLHTEGASTTVRYFLDVIIVMASVASGGAKSYSIPVPGGATASIEKGLSHTVPVKMTTLSEGVQNMVFHVKAEIYYEHDDRTTPNEDFYHRYQNLSFEEDILAGGSVAPARALHVGKTLVQSPYQAAGAEIPQDQWQFVLGESSGFAAAVLLVPSLLLGGTYGKTSRRFFNTVLGGAKRRVMFHNLVSLGLSIVAVVHIILFTYEVRYTILMGVLWGGLGALSLLVLGLTGYYQVPLIQRHGYKWWRYVHLVFGLLVVVFVSYHALIDGADFMFAREGVPQWVKDFNLALK
ncbi:MAG TPA: ferric reductase-like transmembrane domain-containing protein [Candidatus Thermoplasmatota archaeon]|nr:ferric reductase-like transmembrane domain-containing protein [Candidatus Thermoplasmatota archaeon]